MRTYFHIISILFLLVLFPIGVFSQDDTEDSSCMECHGDEELVGEIDGIEKSMFVNIERFQQSSHGENGCVSCHDDIEELPHDFELKKVDCSNCHESQDELSDSVHDVDNGPKCVDCHGMAHNILPADNAQSLMHQFRVSNVCANCHSEEQTIQGEYNVDIYKREKLYRESVHAKELENGNKDAPTCIDCHGHHSILPLRNPESKTHFMNVSNTCGQCHESANQDFLESDHGKSAAYGHKDAPICTDCHGEHAIFRTSDPRSPVHFFNVSKNTCGRCHASIVISEKFNIPAGRVDNFFDSYHGRALQHGSEEVATCVSCHNGHLILGSDDPRSSISKENLVETCAKCHPGIGDNVLKAPIHTDVTLRSDYIAAWVPRLYLPLILLVVGGMLWHNGYILWVLLKDRFRKESTKKSYTRFTTFEIVCHIILSITFIALVITGFALVNPNSWWVTLLSYLGLTEYSRAFLHRVNAVLMIGISIVYAFYMLFHKRGRSELMAFMPNFRDITHVFENIAYYRGKRKEPPHFDRYDYAEKMEFWALIWGIIIMTVSGLILWFPILSFQYLPKWAIDIAELIHYYEAVLATLAILIWHFFFVIFHPEEYPMSITWLNGKMTLDHLKHRHPAEYERLYNQQEVKNDETSDEETNESKQ
jgi:cytochrome b subunit of formate dehydrogenase